MKRSVILSAVLAAAMLAGAGCSGKKKTEAKGPFSPELLELAQMMSGSFSSAEQAALDTNYFDIRLEMKRIWPERTDGIWFYVEQAVASRQDTPYRQRVYQLSQPDDSTFWSSVFAFRNDPLAFAGAYHDSSLVAKLTLDSLVLRRGCAIELKRLAPEKFVGGTVGSGCESELHGASYATSEVTITPEALTSWDRGFDDNGTQVWGAEDGAYVFTKIDAYPL